MNRCHGKVSRADFVRRLLLRRPVINANISNTSRSVLSISLAVADTLARVSCRICEPKPSRKCNDLPFFAVVAVSVELSVHRSSTCQYGVRRWLKASSWLSFFHTDFRLLFLNVLNLSGYSWDFFWALD